MRTGSVRREQTKTTCTQAELDDWVGSVEDPETETGRAQFRHWTRYVQGTFPPCLGCGSPVNAASGPALTVSMDSIIGIPLTASMKDSIVGISVDSNEMVTIGTATFQPCGHGLRIQVRAEQAKRL
jgi:hypothetical protein